MGLIEVYNDGFTEASYIKALDAGWHVMPSANSDTHDADWIWGRDMRTVLLARNLTPADLYAAMRAQRGYATLDKNLSVRFSVNGGVMGSTLRARVVVHGRREDLGSGRPRGTRRATRSRSWRSSPTAEWSSAACKPSAAAGTRTIDLDGEGPARQRRGTSGCA